MKISNFNNKFLTKLTLSSFSLFIVEFSKPIFGIGTGGAGAFFFFLLNVIPSLDEANDDVDPLKLWPGELLKRGAGSGVIECLEYLYFNIS